MSLFNSFNEAADNGDDYTSGTVTEQQSMAYNAVAVAIFIIVSYTFLFPCNFCIPLDRRTVAVLGATLCYATRTFIFQDHSKMNMLHAVDFDVLVLLASIMAINHIVVHLKETKSAVRYMQQQVQKSPQRGFWLVSFAAFIIAPFLTNDGVCLLFVELILNAFDGAGSVHDIITDDSSAVVSRGDGSSPPAITGNQTHKEGSPGLSQANKLVKEDALYFLLTLACSSNIGSALTYTGNPQNMIVAQDAVSVMPPLKFLGIMLIPSIASWLITTSWIQYCWNSSKKEAARGNQHQALLEGDNNVENPILGGEGEGDIELQLVPRDPSLAVAVAGEGKDGSREDASKAAALAAEDAAYGDQEEATVSGKYQQRPTSLKSSSNENGSAKSSSWNIFNLSTPQRSGKAAEPTKKSIFSPVIALLSPSAGHRTGPPPPTPLTPRRRRAKARAAMVHKVSRVVASPVPYLAIVLLFGMIVMIFVDIIPIAALVCLSAMVMVLVLVFGNHMRHQFIWDEEPLHQPTSVAHHQQRVRSTGRSRSVSYAEGTFNQSSDEAGVATRQRRRTLSNAATDIKDGETSAAASGGGSGSGVKIGELAPLHISEHHHEQHEHHEDEINKYPLTREEKAENINEFFEDLFNSIDYSLLLIFLGTFIVIANVDSTGIPKRIWDKIVGRTPFYTFGSVLGICLFVLISSQLLGNVAVVQLAKPNVATLGDTAKAYAWAVISFVATVGGNLTITGSAANIIVAEKAARIDPDSAIDFFRHYRVCFWVTLFSCAVGALLITGVFALESLVLQH